MDIYFTSVGMNGVLLLNLPPDKEGRLAEADVESLRGFRRLYDATFSRNLLTGSKVVCRLSEGKAGNVVDGDYDTSVLPDMKGGRAVFLFRMKHPTAFNVLSIQEDIRKGQRVEAFSLEVKDARGKWKEVAAGTTVGHKRLLKFPIQTAGEVRLTIRQARAVPAISEIGLYRLVE